MARTLKGDFTKLQKFIAEYRLLVLLKDEELITLFSQIHKKYYSLMALIYELELIGEEGEEIFIPEEKDLFFETVSDVGNSLFLTIHGAYKPARLILRSSIETFLKGYSIAKLPEIDKEKRIYQMFEQIAEISCFQESTNKNIFNQILGFYSELSKDTHTATKKQMQHTSSLNYFPTKSVDEVKKITDIISKLIPHYLFLVSVKFNNEFHKIHHDNKKIIIDNIKKKLRPIIHNIN